MNDPIFECDHLCMRYLEKECFTEDGNGMCDQPEMYRELGDHIDYLLDLARDTIGSNYDPNVYKRCI